MKEELYVYTDNGRWKLDLPVPSGITMKWVNNLFSDLSKLTCSYTYTFKLPMTRNNSEALDQAEDIRHPSSVIRKKINAEYILNGVPFCKNANLYISEISKDSYSCVMTWGVLKAFQTLKESSLKLNELGSVGFFDWKDDDANFSYGYPSSAYKNTENLIYPDYDAGCPHYAGTPPRPVMPIYRIIQLINQKFGTRFEIGQEITKGMGAMPLADFNNFRYHGRRVYDDYISHGVLPLTTAYLDNSNKIVRDLTQIGVFCMRYINESGTAQYHMALQDIRDQFGRVVTMRMFVDFIEYTPPSEAPCTAVGIPVFDNFKSNDKIKPLSARRVGSIFRQPSWLYSRDYYDDFIAQGASPWVIEGSTSYQSLVTTQFGNTDSNYQGAAYNVIGYKCILEHELTGSLKLHIAKSAVDAGRVQLTEYRWISIAKAKKSGNDFYDDNENEDAEWEVESDKDTSKWLGLQSSATYTYDSATDSYIYPFDFGEEISARKLKMDANDDDDFYGYFFIPYFPADETVDDVLQLHEGDIWTSDFHIATISPNVVIDTLPVKLDAVSNLPDITCFDFMKAVFYMNGAVPTVGKDGETILPMYYNKIRDSIVDGVTLDWSKKLVGSPNAQSDKIKFSSSSFGQHNYFELNNSDREKSAMDDEEETDVFDTAYGDITIDDKSLDEEKSLYKAPFYSAYIRDLQYPTVKVGRTTKVWNGVRELSEESKPIYGILVYRSLDGTFEDISNISQRHTQSTHGADFKQIRMNTFNPFTDMEEFFGYLREIMQNYKLVKEQLNLNEFDIADLDMTVPIYLDKYNSYFAISTLQRDKDGKFTAELIHLPMVVAEYPEPETDLFGDDTGGGGGDDPVTEYEERFKYSISAYPGQYGSPTPLYWRRSAQDEWTKQDESFYYLSSTEFNNDTVFVKSDERLHHMRIDTDAYYAKYDHYGNKSVAKSSRLILTINGVEVGRRSSGTDYPDVYGLTNSLEYVFPTDGSVQDFLVELTLEIFMGGVVVRTFTAEFTIDPLIPYVNPDVQISNLSTSGYVQSSLSEDMFVIKDSDEAIVKNNGRFIIMEDGAFIKEAAMLEADTQYTLNFDNLIGQTASYNYVDPEVSSVVQQLTSSHITVKFDNVAVTTGQTVTIAANDSSSHTIKVEFDILDPNGNVYEHCVEEITYKRTAPIDLVYDSFGSSLYFSFNFQYRIPNTSVVYNCRFKYYKQDGTTEIKNQDGHTYPPANYGDLVNNLGGGPLIYGDWETNPYTVTLVLGNNQHTYHKRYMYNGRQLKVRSVSVQQQVYWDNVLVTSDKQMTFSKSQVNETHVLKVVDEINGQQKEYNFTYYVLLNS